jgi:hypothetical protein
MPRDPEPLPLAARRALWNRVWDRLLSAPRQEPAEPDEVPRPETLIGPHPGSDQGPSDVQ